MGLRGQTEAGLLEEPTSRYRRPALGSPRERAPKGEVAFLEVTVPKIIIKYLLGKVSGELLEECSPLRLPANGRADFEIEHNNVGDVIRHQGNDSHDETATTYPPGWLK